MSTPRHVRLAATRPVARVFACVFVAAAGCSRAPAPPAAAREAAVYTTFAPTTYFAERIAQGAVPVVCPLPADADPIFWTPSPEVIGRYQAAALIVVNGASFEKWVATASLPDARVVDASGGLADDELIRYESSTTHSHGMAGAHTHEGIDGHVWLDPSIARRQASAIAEAMTRAFPAHAGTFADGLAALDADLAGLDERLDTLASRVRAARVLCSHPAYNYLDRRYGWGVTNLDLDPGAPLPDAAWAAIDAARAGDPADRPAIMLWESPPLPGTEAALRERGIEAVLFSPGETVDPGADDADYLALMHANLDRLAAALRQDP